MSSIIAMVVIFCAIVFYVFLAWYVYSNWNSTQSLTLHEYITKFPHVKTENGIVCVNCGSKSFRNMGVSHDEDYRRLITCNGCATPLYQTSK